MRRGEIWLAALDPTIGSEIQKTRPCLIISPPEIHDHLHTVLVAPMTTGSRAAPFRVPLTFQKKSGLVVLDQMRAIDKSRLVKRMGIVNHRTLAHTLEVLRDSITRHVCAIEPRQADGGSAARDGPAGHPRGAVAGDRRYVTAGADPAGCVGRLAGRCASAMTAGQRLIDADDRAPLTIRARL